eukprot:1153977-Pelagomonas_calceolata.AAC.1
MEHTISTHGDQTAILPRPGQPLAQNMCSCSSRPRNGFCLLTIVQCSRALRTRVSILAGVLGDGKVRQGAPLGQGCKAPIRPNSLAGASSIRQVEWGHLLGIAWDFNNCWRLSAKYASIPNTVTARQIRGGLHPVKHLRYWAQQSLSPLTSCSCRRTLALLADSSSSSSKAAAHRVA